MIAKPYQQYRETRVQTANPAQLVVMLYEGLLLFLKQGRKALAAKDVAAAHAALHRAVDILEYLAGTLNMDAGEIARNLLGLYEFSLSRLLQADLQGDPALVDEVIRVIEPLSDAWRQMTAGGAASRAAAAETAVGAD